MKAAAARLGVTVEEYARVRAAGEKWCTVCKTHHPCDAFGKDASRADGLAAGCRHGKAARARALYQPKLGPRHHGPPPSPARDGDKLQARQRVNVEVRTGRRPRPDDLPCVDCGHVRGDDGPRHEYDHHHGYGAEHHLCVEPVCAPCHHKREKARRAD